MGKLNIVAIYLCLIMTSILAESLIKLRIKRISSPLLDDRTVKLAKYVVSIRSRKPQIIFGDNHFCGGAIIAPKYVLTAATCTMDERKVSHISNKLVVVAGTPNRLIRIKSTVRMPVEKMFVPKNFTEHYRNNIAVLKLKRSWPSNNPSIGIINLPQAPAVYEINYLVLGWGRFFKGGPLAGNLVHLEVMLLSRPYCENALKKFKPEMLCAGNVNNSLDDNPCAGDTGSPMIINNTIVGIVSYRLGCGTPHRPSIYTDVWYHRKWIKDVLKNIAVPTICFSPWSVLTVMTVMTT